MDDIEARFTPEEIALLKFNYEKLHESVWENHKISWTVTSLYLPLLFAQDGLLVNLLFDKPDEFEHLEEFIVVGSVGIVIVTFIWWLILWMFSKYNDHRRDRLKLIEGLLSENEIMPDIALIKQYLLDYNIKVKLFKGSTGFKIGFDRLYTAILLLIVMINFFLIIFVLV